MIEVEHVSKRYRLRTSGLDALKRAAQRAAGRPVPAGEHWALRDVSLSVPQGTSLAVVGVNGSGKSTLLRIISGVTPPTSGNLRVSGRVGGVVDLGSGFHGDLTGYENIFLHGTLLGLSRAQIRARLDAIADFAELGSFLNSPVRHYSWGMFLRLGFAVAVHADPDILVVDEALAVGDGYFQWKCLRRIEEMKKEGRTLLFVSHVADAAEAVCERAAWIDGGVVRAEGPSGQIVDEYNRSLFGALLDSEPLDAGHEVAAFAPQARVGTGEALIRDLRLVDTDGRAGRVFTPGRAMTMEFTAHARRPLDEVTIAYSIERVGAAVILVYSDGSDWTCRLPQGESTLRVRIPELRLRPGHYYLTVALKGPVGGTRLDADYRDRPTYDAHLKLYTFTVVEPETPQPAAYSSRMLQLPAKVEVTVEEN